MASDCCASGDSVMILACSGGSNVGQLSNQAAIELTREGFGKMYCLAGIGGQLKGFVQSARDVPVVAAIDGCAVGCAKAILKNAGITDYRHLVVTDLGIEKNKNFDLSEKDVRTVTQALRAACSAGTILDDGQDERAACSTGTVQVKGCCG